MELFCGPTIPTTSSTTGLDPFSTARFCSRTLVWNLLTWGSSSRSGARGPLKSLFYGDNWSSQSKLVGPRLHVQKSLSCNGLLNEHELPYLKSLMVGGAESLSPNPDVSKHVIMLLIETLSRYKPKPYNSRTLNPILTLNPINL